MSEAGKARLPARRAIALGIVQGPAELLPVSSSAHIVLLPWLAGWDWEAIAGVWEKVGEELDELREASDDASRLHEVGDVLFATVNLARWMHIDPEEALRVANRRWIERYERVERLAAERGIDLGSLSLAEKDVLWDEVKRQ